MNTTSAFETIPCKGENSNNRHYVFTINNYTDDDLNAIGDIDPKTEGVSYLIAGLEVGEGGTPHIQGYVELTKGRRMKSMCHLLGGRAWLAQRRGTREQARDYCKKEGNFEEIGTWKTVGQGRRTDLEGLIEACQKKTPVKEIMLNMPLTVAKYPKFFDKFYSLCERDLSREKRTIETTVIWGEKGCGKTNYINSREPSLFWIDPDNVNFPFDGYDGEEAIVFDDFYGGIKQHTMLRILDEYQYRVNVKGGHRYAMWKRVYITSNKAPEYWYSNGLMPALEDRLNTIIHCTKKTSYRKACNKIDTDDLSSFSQSNNVCNEAGGNNNAPAVTPIDNIGPPSTMSIEDMASTPSVGLRQAAPRVACPPCPPRAPSAWQGLCLSSDKSSEDISSHEQTCDYCKKTKLTQPLPYATIEGDISVIQMSTP